MLYPLNGNCIVTMDSVTSLHPSVEADLSRCGMSATHVNDDAK